MTSPAPASTDSDGSGSSRVELRTLGRTDLSARDDRGAAGSGALYEILRQPKRFALLAYLTIATPRGRHRRDRLTGLLWPRMAPDRSRAALRRAVYFLRRRLGDDVLPGKGANRIGIDDTRLWCDAAALDRRVAEERYEEALELYRGELLPGLRVDDAPGFERWLDLRRRALRRSATLAALTLAARARQGGRSTREADLLERALEISPEREPVLRDLLRARTRSEDPMRGLETYRRWRRSREEEGMAPSARTRALAEAIRSDGTLAATESETPAEASFPDGGGRDRPADAPAIISPRRIAAQDLAKRARELAEGGRAKNLAGQELAAEALRLDPDSAAAYAARAETRAQAVQLFGASRELLRGAIDDVDRALTLAPHLPEAHFSHGLVLETGGRLRAAIRPFRRATLLSDGDPESSSHLGRVLMLRGGFARSLDWTHRQVERRTATPHHLLQLGLDHWCLGRHEEATALYRRARDEGGHMVWLDASWSYFELIRGRFDRARELADEMLTAQPAAFCGHFAAGDVALFSRDFAAAAEHYERCYRLDPESRHPGIQRSTRLALGFARMQAGDSTTGRALVEAAERETARLVTDGADYCGLWVDLAAARAILGRRDQALDTLARATEEGWRQPDFLRHDPMFDDLRGDDRFEGMIGFTERDIRDQRQELPGIVLDDSAGLGA